MPSPRTWTPRRPLVYLLFDEFPVIDLMNGKEQIDTKRFPNFARLAADVHLVPQHDHALVVDDRRRPGDPHREPADPRRPPGRAELPGQPLHAAGERVSHEGQRVADASLPSGHLQAQGCRAPGRGSPPSTRTRASSTCISSRRPPLEDRLPAIDESWGNFGSDTGDELAGELPKVNIHTFYIGRVQDFNRFLASFRAQRPRRSRRSTSCTS